MAAGAVRVFAVRGKLFSDGEMFLGGVLIERRHVVGRRRRRVVKNYLDDPCATSDRVCAVSAVIHAEHGGALLLGVNGICVIGHGSSKALSVVSALRIAHSAASHGVMDDLAQLQSPKALT